MIFCFGPNEFDMPQLKLSVTDQLSKLSDLTKSKF